MRVGASELRLLEHCTLVGPTTVRDAAESFGKEQEIGLTTVQQMLERLRKKDLLKREHLNGSWVYTVVETRENVLKGVVRDFVERTLGGSLEPFMLYLSDPSTMSKEDLQRVKDLVSEMGEDGEKKPGE